MDSTIVNSIIGLSFRPMALLTLALAITALISGVVVKRPGKKWIPVTSGILAVSMTAFMLIKPYTILHSTIGSYGMGKPEVVAQATLTFLSAAAFAPFYVFLSLFGIFFALVRKVPARFVLLTLGLLLFLGFDFMMVTRFDYDFTRSMADGRGEREEQLIEIQMQAFQETLKAEGIDHSEQDKTKIDRDLYLPKSVYAEIFREDFFKINKPPSMLAALLTGRYEEASQINSDMLDAAIIDTHREACIESGRRLAREKLENASKN